MSETASAHPEQAGEWDSHWVAYEAATKLNPAHRYRRALIFEALEQQGTSPMRLIDVGCGQGDFLEEARMRFAHAELVGIDFSEAGLALARTRVPGARFFQADFSRADSLPSELKSFATHAVCSEVLEHLDDPGLLLRSARSVLSATAALVVTVPGGPRSAFDRHIGHRRHYSPRELEILMRSAGFSPLFVRGSGFPFFNLYRLAVVLRGERLVRDLDQKQRLSPGSKLAMQLFDGLFHLNTAHTRLGWQTIGAFRPIL
ncbi:MAG: class I SAM-dependent methyltransferase [Myxococcaceae bacterium]|nr:MAG: class I SAM-dependent methyltransferase [Myxococcaceae bacterium]